MCICIKIKQFLHFIQIPVNWNTPVIIWKNTPPNVLYLQNVYLFVESFTVFSHKRPYLLRWYIYMHKHLFNKRIWCWMSFIEEGKKWWAFIEANRNLERGKEVYIHARCTCFFVAFSCLSNELIWPTNEVNNKERKK